MYYAYAHLGELKVTSTKWNIKGKTVSVHQMSMLTNKMLSDFMFLCSCLDILSTD